MQKLRYLVTLILLAGFLVFLFSDRYAPIRAKFQRPQPRFYSSLPSYSQEEAPFYQPTTTTAFTMLNTFKNVHTWYEGQSAGDWYEARPLLIVDDKILIAGDIEDELSNNYYDQHDLFAVDISTGTIYWQTAIDVSGVNRLATDGERVYMQASGDGGVEPAHIQALNLQSGDLLWDTRLDFSYAIYVRFLTLTDSDLIAITGNRGQEAQYRLDRETGEIKERRSNDFVETRPQYAGLIFEREEYWMFNTVVAVREADSAVVWRYEQTVVSNVAVNGPITYFVTQDAQLVVVNTQTGELLGQMQFTPVFPADFDFSNNVIIVAAADDLVAVYFPDQQQLSIFRFDPS